MTVEQDLTRFNWDGDVTQLTDQQLEQRHVALSRYIAAGLVIRDRDMREQEEAERAAPTELWRQTHNEIARRIALKPNRLHLASGRLATPDEIEAWFGTVPSDPHE